MYKLIVSELAHPRHRLEFGFLPFSVYHWIIAYNKTALNSSVFSGYVGTSSNFNLSGYSGYGTGKHCIENA
jgi:hypothetical protein